MEWLLGSIGTLAVAAIAWLFTPIKNWLEPLRMKLTRDHGVKLQVCSTMDDLRGALLH